MRTSQSFPFYASDFIMGTMLMTGEEVGAYIRMLCWQWEQGFVPSDPAKLARISGVNPKKLAAVLEKFDEDSDGNLKNFRMEEVRNERETYIELQRSKGLKGGRPKGKRPKPGDSREKAAGLFRLSETGGFEKAEKSPPSPSPSPLPNYPLPQVDDDLDSPKADQALTAIQLAITNVVLPSGISRKPAPFTSAEKRALSALIARLGEETILEDMDKMRQAKSQGWAYGCTGRAALMSKWDSQAGMASIYLKQPKSQASKYGNLNPQKGVC